MNEFKDHVVQNPDKFIVTDNPDGTKTIKPFWVENPTDILQAGTPVNAETLNAIPTAINELDTKVTTQLADTAIQVASYGAVGDGVADDTQAFRDALNNAKTFGHSRVVASKGKTYKVSDKIPITFDNVVLDLQGAKIIYENDKNVNTDAQYWQSVFYAAGGEDVNTNAVISGYKTVCDGTDAQGNFILKGRWKVSSTLGFAVNSFIFIDVPLDQTIQDYTDARPACQMATKVIAVDAVGGYIYTEYFSPFDWSRRVWYGTEKLWKITPLQNVTVKNVYFEDRNPQILRDIFNSDTLANRQKQLSVVGGKYVVNFNVENVYATQYHQQAVVTYGCIGVNVKNVDGVEPRYLGSGQGYAVQFKHSYNIIAENIRGFKVRHLIDFTSSAFAKVSQCYSASEMNYAYDVHGFCEHNITFENCTGSLEISNSVQYFPNMVNNIVFEGCELHSAFINWGDNVTFRNSTVALIGLNAIADIKVLDVGKFVFDKCTVKVPNQTRFVGRKRSIPNYVTSCKFIDCDIVGLKDGTEDAANSVYAQTLDLLELRSNRLDFTEINTQIEIRDVDRLISRDNIYKNTYVFIQGDSVAVWKLDFNSFGDTFDVDDTCKKLIAGNKVPLQFAGARNRIGKINVKDSTWKLRSNSQVIDFVNIPNGGSSMANSKIFVTYDGVDVETIGTANTRAYIGQYQDVIFTFKNWQHRSIGTGVMTGAGAYNLATVNGMDKSFPEKSTAAPTGFYNNPYSGQIVWNSATASGQPMGWIWNGTAFVALPSIA